MTNELPQLPDGYEWKEASAIKVGDVLQGTLDGRVISVEPKPKTVWLRVEPADPDDMRLAMLPFGMKPKLDIRPHHGDMLAVKS